MLRRMLPLLILVLVARDSMAPGVMSAAAQTARVETLSSAAYVEDFEEAWIFVRDNYAYFGLEKTDWESVRAQFLPRARSVRNNGEFIGLLEGMLEQLYDPHAHLGTNTASSPRLVPSGTDLWAEHRDGRAVITAVRSGSEAERVGLRAGMEIGSIGGKPVREAVRSRLPVTLREADPAAEDWALRAALAGRHDAPVVVAIRIGGRGKDFEFRPGATRPHRNPLAVEILDGNIGYIRLHDSLGDNALLAAWDSALVRIRDTRGLVLDLRDTPSGGNTTIARGLLGRLVADVRPYQRHDPPSEERQYGVQRIWVEYVAPRGPFTYEKPVAALVGRWTGSMGEGVAIGLDGMQRAKVIGTPMAGLRGANYDVTLQHSGIQVRVPAERLYHVDGTPREAFVPRFLVEPTPSKVDETLAVATGLLRNDDGVNSR
jgi:carboxyl-terminal processing protease